MIHIHIPSILSKQHSQPSVEYCVIFKYLHHHRYICFIAGADVAPVVPHGK